MDKMFLYYTLGGLSIVVMLLATAIACLFFYIYVSYKKILRQEL